MAACTSASEAPTPTPQPEPTAELDLDPAAATEALYTAVQEDDNTAIAQYIAAGGDVNDGGLLDVPMLNIAVQRDNAEGVALLLEAGASFDAASFNQVILGTNNLDTIQAFIDHGADVNEAEDDGQFGITPLMRAAETGSVEVAMLLLENGAEINKVDNYNDPALNYGAYFGNLEFIQALVAEGAKTDFVGYEGNTALSFAQNQGHEEVVAYLMSLGSSDAPMDALDPAAATEALYTAVQEDNNALIAQYIAAGADVDDGGMLDVPMLQIAAQRGNEEGVSLLLEAGATIDAEIFKGAILNADKAPDMIQTFIDYGADIHEPEPNTPAHTPLMHAAEAGNVEIGLLLLENGVDIEAVDEFNDPALNVAAFNGNLEFTQMLVDQGAELNVPGFGGATALVHARNQGHDEIVNYLASVGGTE